MFAASPAVSFFPFLSILPSDVGIEISSLTENLSLRFVYQQSNFLSVDSKQRFSHRKCFSLSLSTTVFSLSLSLSLFLSSLRLSFPRFIILRLRWPSTRRRVAIDFKIRRRTPCASSPPVVPPPHHPVCPRFPVSAIAAAKPATVHEDMVQEFAVRIK